MLFFKSIREVAMLDDRPSTFAAVVEGIGALFVRTGESNSMPNNA